MLALVHSSESVCNDGAKGLQLSSSTDKLSLASKTVPIIIEENAVFLIFDVQMCT